MRSKLQTLTPTIKFYEVNIFTFCVCIRLSIKKGLICWGKEGGGGLKDEPSAVNQTRMFVRVPKFF